MYKLSILCVEVMVQSMSFSVHHLLEHNVVQLGFQCFPPSITSFTEVHHNLMVLHLDCLRLRPLFFTISHPASLVYFVRNWFSLFFFSSSIILPLNLPPQLRWDCRRIVNCAGIETIAILIRATVVNTKLSTVNLKGMSNYIVHCPGGLSPMSLRCVE